MNFIKG